MLNGENIFDTETQTETRNLATRPVETEILASRSKSRRKVWWLNFNVAGQSDSPEGSTGDVVAASRRGVEAEQVLGGEDGDAGRVQTEQLDAEPLTARNLQSAAPVAAARHRLHDVGQYRNGKNETFWNQESMVVAYGRRNKDFKICRKVSQSLLNGLRCWPAS